MVNTEIRLIIFFSAKNGEALYSQQKQDRELTVAQIMNSLLPNSDLKKIGKTTRPFRYDLNQITCMWVKVAQLCLALCIPMDYTVHGILQARILEWVAFPFSRWSSQLSDQTQVSHIAGGFFTG